MSARTNHADTIGGIAILACVLIGVMAYVFGLLREYGPSLRAFLLDAITWQFALGMVFMACVFAVMVWAFASVDP